MTRWFVAILCVMLLPMTAWGQTRVAMKVAARVPRGGAIHVRDVAEVSGDNAETVADLVLVADPEKETPEGATWVEVSPSRVKEAAEQAGIAPATIIMAGPSCAVRFIGLAGFADRPSAVSPASVSSEAPESNAAASDGLVKGVVLARLAQMLQVTPSELRVSFNDRDDTLLNRSTAGLRVLAVPTASALSQRIPIRVTLFDGDTLVDERTVSTDVLVKMETVVMLTGVDRGVEITPSVISQRTQWVAPSSRPPATREQAIGSVARTRLEAGQMIETGDVESPIAAKRGEIVYVDCLSGRLVVKVRARAVGTVREGEIAELKIDGGDGSFFARMSGKGRAVMLVGGEQIAK